MSTNGTVIYIGGFELPDKNAAAHRVVNNAKIFRDIGFDVVLIDSCREQANELEKKEDCFGFRRYSIKKSDKQLYSVKKIISVIEKEADTRAVIAYNYPAIGLLRLQKYCKKHNIKIIADATEWYGISGGNIIHKTIKAIDTYLRMQVIHQKTDGIIAISRYLESFYGNKTKTVFIPPLTDLSEEKWSQKADEIPEDKIRVVYAGSPGQSKDKLNLILRALEKCDKEKIIFSVIGITKKQFESTYPEDAILLQSLSGSVEFLGRRPHTEVIKEVKSSDFVLFYRDVTRVTMAGFPTKFAEAITCGTPVLTNKTSDLKDYLIDGENGFWIDNIEDDLKRIFDFDIKTLKKVKNGVDKNLFDYHNYINDMAAFI